MENLLRTIYQERASQPNTLGIIAVTKNELDIPITNNFDSVFLLVVQEQNEGLLVKQYQVEKEKAAIYSITMDTLVESLTFSTNKKVFEWIHYGKIIYDRNETLTRLKDQFMAYPQNRRELKMNIEYAKLIKRYKNGKALFEQENYLDAYNSVIHSLHHLARLAIIEKGFHPEVTVWKQVKDIDGQILKLYEELVFSTENLKERLELLFLASDFLIYSKLKTCMKHFFDILSQRDCWSATDIYAHQEVQPYAIDLDTLLEYLIEKKVLHFELEGTKNDKIYKLLYKI